MIKIIHQSHLKKIIILISMLCITSNNYAHDEDQFERIWEGNLALPTSQQPGALIALGQNIIDKNDLLIFIDYDLIKGKNKKYETITPSLLYGINDKSSLFITIPVATKFKDDNQQSSGIGDITAQYEYSYFNKYKPSYGIQGTVLANVGLPTGSLKKDPPTGFGSTSFFLGTTFSYLSTHWYAYSSLGVTLTTSRHGSKHGNQYLYQGGFGKNIAYRPKKWILSWIIEIDGTYEQRDKINKAIDKNSGGNTLLGGYTLWFSTKKLIAICDISVPITQHLFGKQNKTNYTFELIVGWKFN